ncbi:MAG: diphthine--ammonia ligase [Nitrososphaerota archaeon]|jgi:ABC transporter with metal-binding/Fe-S-binding domain ATP-binding protein|nr:diphthine--ammonia ligase [Nitrososphaerota archaeon]
MKFGVLFSGGKDSTLALHLAAEKGQVACLITVVSKNKESYMFHTPNVDITVLQAQALGLPLVSVVTEGCKEVELVDLEAAVLQAKVQFGVEGVVTGAVESVYQMSRIQRVCSKLGLECFNPLWRCNQRWLLDELLERNFRVVISGVFAYPLDVSWLGKQLDYDVIERLSVLSEKYGISITGEGGEIETTVLDAPMFKQKIDVINSETIWDRTSGVYVIKNAFLVLK